MIFTHHAQMRFSDLDALGHVNHARFLTYVEDARIRLLDELAKTTGDGTPGVILAHIDLDYLVPLTLSVEPVEVDIWVAEIGSKSFTIRQEIRHQGQLAATGSTTMVAFDYGTQATRRLTKAEREVLHDWRSPSLDERK